MPEQHQQRSSTASIRRTMAMFFWTVAAALFCSAVVPLWSVDAVTIRINNPYPGVRVPPLASSTSMGSFGANEFEPEHYEELDDEISARGVLPECEGVSWKDYIGINATLGNDPTPCYQPTPAISGDTIEKHAVRFYNKHLLTTEYAKFALIYASNINNRVPWFGISFTGEENVIAYSELGNTGELYEIVEQNFSQRIIQDGRHVVAFVDVFYHVYFTESTWNTTAVWYFRFNDRHEVEQLDIYIDTLGTSMNLGTSQLQFNYTNMCIRYFESCTGANQFFADFQECYDYYSSLPPNTGYTPLNGKHIVCAYTHLIFTAQVPTPHCRHASNLKLDPELDVCQDW